jgi:hypothetical protein
VQRDEALRAELPRAGSRRGVGLLSALHAHAKAPYKTDLLWETRRALNRPGRARTDSSESIPRTPPTATMKMMASVTRSIDHQVTLCAVLASAAEFPRL